MKSRLLVVVLSCLLGAGAAPATATESAPPEPAETPASSAPADPVEPADPVDPVDQAEAADPVDPTDPTPELPPLPVEEPAPPAPDEPVEPVEPGRTPGPTRIMLVGDSVTHGYPGDYTYRFRLWEALTRQGVAFDFVGHRNDLGRPAEGPRDAQGYVNTNFDRDHSGEGGSRFHTLRFPLQETVHDLEPDVVVVMLGINDLREGRSALSVTGVAERFVRQVREVAPTVKIVLAHASQSQYRNVLDYNARLDVLARRISTAASPVVTARTGDGYTVADQWDHLHPNGRGEVKIARAIHSSLVTLGIAPRTAVAWPNPPAGPVIPVRDLRHAAGRGVVYLAWGHSPGATAYVVAYRDPRNGKWTTRAPAPGLKASVRGLVPNAVYTFAVRPAKGKDVAESRVAVTATVRAGDGTVTRPAAPALPTVTQRGSTVTVTWPHLVDNGGAALKHYLVRHSSSRGNRWITVPATQNRLVLRNQPRGWATVTVYATNQAGNSPASPVGRFSVR